MGIIRSSPFFFFFLPRPSQNEEDKIRDALKNGRCLSALDPEFRPVLSGLALHPEMAKLGARQRTRTRRKISVDDGKKGGGGEDGDKGGGKEDKKKEEEEDRDKKKKGKEEEEEEKKRKKGRQQQQQQQQQQVEDRKKREEEPQKSKIEQVGASLHNTRIEWPPNQYSWRQFSVAYYKKKLVVGVAWCKPENSTPTTVVLWCGSSGINVLVGQAQRPNQRWCH